jgi:hypothetical protein
MNGINGTLLDLHRSVEGGSLDAPLLRRVVGDLSLLNECEVIDFKRQLPASDTEYAKAMRDIVALHNSYGGYLIFGVDEVAKDRTFKLVGVDQSALHLQKIRDGIRAYASVDLRVKGFGLEVDGICLYGLWVAKRVAGELPVRFQRNGPDDKPGKPIFKRGDVVFRRIESNDVAKSAEDFDFLFSERKPPSLELSENVGAGEALENNLPDRAIVCAKFIGRKDDIGDLWAWLADDFSRVRLIAGQGGLGKTSLAYRFSEEVAVRSLKPFNKVVWLTAKKRQFIASKDEYRDADHVDFSDADSLFRAIARALGCVESDFDGLDTKGVMQAALQSCVTVPAFIVVDDVDSLTQPDQLRVLEFGMRTPQGTKILLTTRINFSYSPDNVLQLEGLPSDEFADYVQLLRSRYGLPAIKEGKVEQLRSVTGGFPLFADSLLRLERRGMQLDQAMSQWKGEKGLEARKAALQREVGQLSREAKRVLFVVSLLKSASYVELAQVVNYAEQTLGDALQELSGLFLISAPVIAKEARYQVEPNTGLLVQEIAPVLGIDHAALLAATKKLGSDAIGLGRIKRSGIVGLAISEASATLKEKGGKAAIEVINAASKKLSKPHPDLLLAFGRFSLKLDPPDYSGAGGAFEQSYDLGQRKTLLFDLWFEAEVARGRFESATEVASRALEHLGDNYRWFERRAQAHIKLAEQSRSRFTNDAAIREVEAAISDFRAARKMVLGSIQQRRFDQLIKQAEMIKNRLVEAQPA